LDDCLASLDRILNAFSIVQVSLHILKGSFDLPPSWRPVEDPDFISLPGKIFGQVTADIACTTSNQDTHGLPQKKKSGNSPERPRPPQPGKIPKKCPGRDTKFIIPARGLISP
jgi:hypothetical protein